MLTLPHMFLTECGGACCLPPHPLHSGAGSQPSACPAHEEPCPCHLSLSTPWPSAAHLLSASTSVQLGMQSFPRDQDRQPSAAHPDSRSDCSPPASCRVPFRRKQGPIIHPHRHPCHPYPEGCSPQRLGLRKLRGSWRHDIKRPECGWAGTPGKPVKAGTAKAQLHLPSRWNWLSEGWSGGYACWKIMPWPGSCPSPEQGGGAQDPSYIALSLEVPSRIPGLVCLELAPCCSCTPAAPPAAAWGLRPP